ncbi:hypothetical protein WAI453_010478 [Rhynchosporium graminicola]
MKCLYKNFFGAEPLSPNYTQVHSSPDRITIVFVHLGGPTYSMSLPRRSTVLEVKKQIQAKRGKPVDGPYYQMFYTSKEPEAPLVDWITLEEYGFEDSDAIHLYT